MPERYPYKNAIVEIHRSYPSMFQAIEDLFLGKFMSFVYFFFFFFLLNFFVNSFKLIFGYFFKLHLSSLIALLSARILSIILDQVCLLFGVK